MNHKEIESIAAKPPTTTHRAVYGATNQTTNKTINNQLKKYEPRTITKHHADQS